MNDQTKELEAEIIARLTPPVITVEAVNGKTPKMTFSSVAFDYVMPNVMAAIEAYCTKREVAARIKELEQAKKIEVNQEDDPLLVVGKIQQYLADRIQSLKEDSK